MKQTKKRMRYFCYGSNLNIDQMSRRCPAAKVVGPGTLEGFRLEFQGNATGNGFCTIERDTYKRTQGGLWTITDRDLKALDWYEGYPRLYRRITIPVKTDEGTVMAMTYQMTPGHPLALPADYYVDICLAGYSDFGLDKRAFRAAMRSTQIRHERQPAFMGWRQRGNSLWQKESNVL